MSQNPYAGGPQPGYEAWYEQPRESSISVMAVLSLIFSILCLTAPLGIILGVASLFTIGASGGRKHGKGLAISGIVVGLVFSTCATFVLVGAVTSLQMMQKQFAIPAARTLQAIDDGDFATARTGLSPGAVVTDEQLVAFRDAYQAELGKFKGTSKTGGELVSNWMKVVPAWQTFSKTQQAGRRDDLIPIGMDFEKGPALLGLVIRGSDKPDNLVLFTLNGKTLWLVDPSGRTLPPPPPPPATPETPKPAPPESPSEAPAEPQTPSGGG